MRKFVKIYLLTLVVFITVISIVVLHYETKVTAINTSNKIYVEKLNSTHKEEILKYETYEYLYNDNMTQLAQEQVKYKELKADYDSFKSNVAFTKLSQTYSRGGADDDLTKFSPITTDELNAWIKAKAPANSPFIGKGDSFILASKDTGLDPKYIVAHAALESGWGTSSLAKSKNNFYGIGAFNSSPNSAYNFDTVRDGIVSGAKWIYDNYISEGQNTLEKMIYGHKAYCVTNAGVPDSEWITKVGSIMVRDY